jgi:predicted MFS family arabinose efflux permease
VNLHLVVVLTVLLHLAFAGSRVTLSLFAISLNATPFTVGVIISLLAIVPMLFSVHAGRVIDRIGVRRPMLAGAAAVSAAMLLAFALPRLDALFFVSALAGSGFILFHIAVNHAAGVVGRPEDRGKNFSLLALGFSTSGFLGPMIAGFAIDAVGYRHVFLLLACSSLITLLALTFKRMEIPPQEPTAKLVGKKRLIDLLRVPTLRRVFIASAILSMSWDLFTFVTPIHGSRIGLSASTIGLILGVFGAAIFIVRLLLPLLVHRVSEWQLLTAAMFMTGFTLLVFPVVDRIPLLLLLAFILGVGLGGAQPMIMALLYNRAPPGRGGEAVGVRTLLLNITQSGIPLLFGALGSALGMTPVFWAMALTLLAGGWFSRRGEDRP